MNRFYLLELVCFSSLLQSMDQTPPPPLNFTNAPKQIERKHSGDSTQSTKVTSCMQLGSKNSAFNILTIQTSRLQISTIIPSGLGAKKIKRSDSILTQAPDSPCQDSDDENSNTQSAQPKTPRESLMLSRSRSSSPDEKSEDI
jgi:hypothetical protein